MWLNQKTIDGLIIMAALAAESRLLRAQDLVAKTNITLMNVQKTVNALSQSGLILATRGRGGGIKLAKNANAIHLSEIIRVFEPTDCPINFLKTNPIETQISNLLFKAHRGFFAPLENKTLEDLLTNFVKK